VGRPLWREDGSVVYNCCWSLPAKWFSGQSSAGLMTIFYCFIFETPPTWKARSPYLYPPWTGWSVIPPGIFVASCDLQGYGGDIRTHLHTGWLHQITAPAYTTSARTAWKTTFLSCGAIVQFVSDSATMWSLLQLFVEPLLSDGCRICAYFAVVA
jgi:hypothetical protein